MEVLTWMYCLFVTCAEPATDLAGPSSEITRPPGEVACDLNGFWYNNLGSEMFLNVALDGEIKGEYRTAVEYKHGAAGDGPSHVTGRVSNDGTIFGFTVLWEGHNTTSVTSWGGVCEDQCEGETALVTQWSHYYIGDNRCMDSISRTGSDTFTRSDTTPGPRLLHKTHTPRDFRERARLLERNGEQ